MQSQEVTSSTQSDAFFFRALIAHHPMLTAAEVEREQPGLLKTELEKHSLITPQSVGGLGGVLLKKSGPSN